MRLAIAKGLAVVALVGGLALAYLTALVLDGLTREPRRRA